MPSTQKIYCVAVFIALTGFNYPVASQTTFDKPIRLIVPQAPGSTADFLARALAQNMSESLNQQIIVEARPGAGGAIGATFVAKAAPDGYTLLLGNISTHGVNPSLYAKLPYNAITDFFPISLLAVTENALVVHPSLPVTSVKGLIDLAKRVPGGITFSSAGNGSSQHLGVELFNAMSGANMLHVPYKGGNPAIIAVISGEASVMMPTLPLAHPHVMSKRVRMIAVTSAKRIDQFPATPTVSETLPGYEMVSWFGLLAPSGTQADVIRRLTESVISASNSPSIKKQLIARGLTPQTSSANEFTEYIKSEIEKWTKAAQHANIRAN